MMNLYVCMIENFIVCNFTNLDVTCKTDDKKKTNIANASKMRRMFST